VYKCTSPYNAAGELGVAWNDPELAIAWPTSEPILSDRDRRLPPLAQLRDRLPLVGAAQSLPEPRA
jgi:dTDP-4-dehydrorhamnose 3,5-epimerase